MNVETTMAAVTQMFLSLTVGGQCAVDMVVRRNIHLQTRIAKHLEVSSDTRFGSDGYVADSPPHDGTSDGASNDLDSE